jgi:hypothetical protein
MEDGEHRVVHGLIVVGSLQPNQRLLTENDVLFSTENSYVGQCCWRFLYGEGRDSNLTAVHRVVMKAEQLVGENTVAKHRVLEALKIACVGLDHLTETYRADARAVARIILIKRHITQILLGEDSAVIALPSAS